MHCYPALRSCGLRVPQTCFGKLKGRMLHLVGRAPAIPYWGSVKSHWTVLCFQRPVDQQVESPWQKAMNVFLGLPFWVAYHLSFHKKLGLGNMWWLKMSIWSDWESLRFVWHTSTSGCVYQDDWQMGHHPKERICSSTWKSGGNQWNKNKSGRKPISSGLLFVPLLPGCHRWVALLLYRFPSMDPNDPGLTPLKPWVKMNLLYFLECSVPAAERKLRKSDPNLNTDFRAFFIHTLYV